MVVSVTGIVINVIMVIIIAVILIIGVQSSNELRICETQQSTFCYTIHCPCDQSATGANVPPCFGYAKMPVGPGRWRCSNADLTIVDDNGNIIE